MSKVTLDTVASGYFDTAKLNSNFDAIEEGFDNTLSRDGSTPNTMNANLDMNNKKVLNLPAPGSSSEPLRLADLEALSTLVPDSTLASLVTVVDSANMFTTDNVEAALSETVVTGNVDQTIDGDKTFTGTTTFSGPLVASGATTVAALTASGTLTANGNVVLGSDSSDTTTVNSKLDLSGTVLSGAVPLVFEGSTSDAFETSFEITDPTADRTITFPDASGTVLLSSFVNRGVVGFAYATSSTSDNTTTVIPCDNTVPQITEGKEFLTVTYTPTNASSLLRVKFYCPLTSHSATSGASRRSIALFRDSDADAIVASMSSVDPGGDAESDGGAMTLEAIVSAVAASSTTFRVRFGPSAGTMYVNSLRGTTTKHGAATLSVLSVEEIYVS
jgi:hypothetical protein